MELVFKSLTSWLAPIISFTAEEAWQCWVDDKNNSIHLQEHPKIPENWININLEKKWDRIRKFNLILAYYKLSSKPTPFPLIH